MRLSVTERSAAAASYASYLDAATQRIQKSVKAVVAGIVARLRELGGERRVPCM